MGSRPQRQIHGLGLCLATLAAASLLVVAGRSTALAGGPAPSLTVLLEVQEPGSPDWLDADDVQQSPGSNDATPAEMFPVETALLRITVTNTGDTALSNVHVTEPGCDLDTLVDRLDVATARVFVCERRSVPGDLIETARAEGATPVDGSGSIRDPLPAIEETARLRVFSPAFTLLAEALDTPSHTWLDADANPGSPGSNDGVLARLGPLGEGRFRFTVTNTGLVDLLGLRISGPGCATAVDTERLRPQESRRIECDYRGADARASATGALPATPRGRTSNVALNSQIEDAGYQPAPPAPKVGVSGKPTTTLPLAVLPIDIRLSSPRTTIAGEPVTLVIGLRARPGAKTIRGVRVRYGRRGRARVFGASSPGTLVTAGQVLWEVGDLTPGVWRTVKIRVKATGIGLGRLGGLVRVEAPGSLPTLATLRPTLVQPWGRTPRSTTGLTPRDK